EDSKKNVRCTDAAARGEKPQKQSITGGRCAEHLPFSRLKGFLIEKARFFILGCAVKPNSGIIEKIPKGETKL
ncbi:MAG: hypothetical protein RRY53_05665, partial [Pseudoflavonifractor sp.]